MSNAKKCDRCGKFYEYYKGWNDCIDAIIDNAPTVDKGYIEGHIDGMLKAEKLYARPIGEWIDVPYDYGTGCVDGFKCSVCDVSRVFRSNYCPTCGAKMKGAEE